MPSPVWFGAGATVTREHVIDDGIVVVQLVTPVCVAMGIELLGRTDDVGKHDCLKNPLVRRGARSLDKETQDVVDQFIDGVVSVVRTRRQRIKLCVRNARCQCGNCFDRAELDHPGGP
jgi:hypothetical protein